jgi:signal transduction histidine kinase/ligand-binding sensor domain-containing protein
MDDRPRLALIQIKAAHDFTGSTSPWHCGARRARVAAGVSLTIARRDRWRVSTELVARTGVDEMSPRSMRLEVRRTTIAGCILLAYWGGAFAADPGLDVSQYRHRSWKVRQGFVPSAIQTTGQTADGYLWLGTAAGVYRFDGVRAVALKLSKGEQLPSDDVRKLLGARDGRLWLGTAKGVASWKDGTLTRYPQAEVPEISTLLEDRDGTIWVGGSAGQTARLCAISSAGVRCMGADGSLGRAVNRLYEDKRGRLWVATMEGVWRWNPGPPSFRAIPGYKCGFFYGDDGSLLMLSTSGIARIDDVHETITPLVARETRCGSRPWQDRSGGVWIATVDRGLIHAHGGIVDTFREADGLSGDWVRSLYQDREGNVWVATSDGLDRFTVPAIRTISQKQGLSLASVTSVLAGSDGSVWIGTHDGLNRWKDGRVTIYRGARVPDSDNRRSSYPPAPLGTPRSVVEVATPGLPDSYITSLVEDERHRVWVATLRGLARFEDEHFTAVTIPAFGAAEPWVFALARDPAGNLWISQARGLIRLSNNGADEIPWAAMGQQAQAVSMIADALQGGLWLGFADGAIVHYMDGAVRASFTAANGSGDGTISNLRFDAEGALWAATRGGLSRVKDGRIVTLTRRNGLPCDAVHWAMDAGDGSHWLYTACGLVRIAPGELDAWQRNPERAVQVRLFDVADGVRTEPTSSGASPIVARTADGALWFRQVDGVSIVDPLHLASNPSPPPVRVEEVVADRKAYDVSSGTVRLPPLVRDVFIDYTAMSFVAPEKVAFRYRLEGQDTEWREVVNDREVQYSNLAPGRYRFRVTASNNSSVWNEQGATIDIEVAPAFWQTNWFRALCLIAFAALLFGLYRLRMRQLRERFALTLETRVAERTRIARELHDTLLQSFHGLLLRFQTAFELLPARPAEAKATLGSAIDQAVDAITEGRDAVQGLRTSATESNDLAAAIRVLGDELWAQHGAQGRVALHVEVHGVARPLHPIVRDEAFRLAGEALRNALRHAGASRIEVEVVYEAHQLRLRVRDDGKGIDPGVLERQGESRHFGLEGMRERAAVAGGKLTVWSALDSGTEIELTVPAANAYVATSDHAASSAIRHESNPAP